MRNEYGTGKAVYKRCYRCGKGGARCFHPVLGLMHKYCMSEDERKKYNEQLPYLAGKKKAMQEKKASE